MSRTAVVILNYNGEKLLQQFLPSVIQHSSGADIIIADNNSSDGSVSFIRQSYPQIRIIQLDDNYGYCGGYNRALGHVDADYFVLLNSDIEVTPYWLDPMIGLLDRHAEIAAVQPKVLSYRDKNKFEHAGAGGGFIDSLGYPFCRGRVFDFVEEDLGQYNDEREVFWATGACLMIRSKVFKMLNGFDEDFFAHMEEIDLCWKIQRVNQKVYYCGDSVIYHVGAGTLGYQNPRKTFLNFRNGLSLLLKHLNTTEAVYKLPLRILLDWIAAFQFLLKGQSRNFAAVIRAHFFFLNNLNNDLQKRKVLRKTFPSYNDAMIYKGSVVFHYFFKKRKVFQALRERHEL
jgi:GT2 family glycosyltransferase